MVSEIKVQTRIIPFRRSILRGRVTLPFLGLGRRVVMPDGRVAADITTWVSRREAINHLALHL